jgi:hypothetical protein
VFAATLVIFGRGGSAVATDVSGTAAATTAGAAVSGGGSPDTVLVAGAAETPVFEQASAIPKTAIHPLRSIRCVPSRVT